MADLALGWKNGVAKNVDLTAVQLWEESAEAKHAQYRRNINALDQVINDIVNVRGLVGRAVVIMAWNDKGPFTAHNKHLTYWNNLYRRLTYLDQLGIVLVNGAPNDKKCGSDIPCSFGDRDSGAFIQNLMVVEGGDLNDGSFFKPQDQRDNWISYYAPAKDSKKDSSGNQLGMICANEVQDDGYAGFVGNSAATAMTGGLMAYFMSLGKTFAEARQMVKDYSYSRSANGPQMIWNGITSS